tara:strand:+ start:486 stop:1010 length:525 start_codon:yes stop_codon:yes gene_type:complete
MPQQQPRIFTQIHLNDILGTSSVSIRQAVSGDIFRFYYTSKNQARQVDPRPLVLVVTPVYENKLWGVNLNYLDTAQVERLWQMLPIRKLGTIKQLIEINKRDKPFFRVKTSPSKSYYQGTLRNVLRGVCGDPHLCFRSYSFSRISSPQLIDYGFPGNDYTDDIRQEVINEAAGL